MTLGIEDNELTANERLAVAIENGVELSDVTITDGVTWPDGTTTSNSPEGSTGNVLDLLNYGTADNADDAFESALEAAENGDIILFRDETFNFELEHNIDVGVSLQCRNATIEDNRGTADSTGDALLEYNGGGEQVTESLENGGERGDASIVVTGDVSADFSEGDDIYLEDVVGSEPITQFARVKSVSVSTNTTITLEGALRRDFGSGSDVSTVSLFEGVRVEGFRVQNAATDGTFLAIRWCRNPTVEDFIADDHYRHAVVFNSCWKAFGRDVEARNAGATGSGEGEPFYSVYSTDVYWENPTVYDARRGVDAAAGCTGVTVMNPRVYGVTVSGVSTHADSHVSGLTVIGGEIIGREESSACIDVNSNSDHATIVGTRLVPYRRGLKLDTRATATGVTIEDGENQQSSPNFIEINGDNVSVEADIEFSDYRSFTSVASLSGVSNVEIDINIAVNGYSSGGDDNPFVSITDGCTNVEATVDADSHSSFSAEAVSIYGQSSMNENITINPDITNHGDDGIWVRGDAGISGVHVNGGKVDSDGRCIYVHEFDTMTTCEKMWFTNNDMNSATANEFAIDHDNADQVFLANNVGTESISPNATNVSQDVTTSDQTQYDIQVDGTDGSGIINFKTN